VCAGNRQKPTDPLTPHVCNHCRLPARRLNDLLAGGCYLEFRRDLRVSELNSTERTVIRVHRLIQVVLLLAAVAGASLGHGQGGPPFITDDPGTPGNRHIEINFGWMANHNPAHASYNVPNFDFNYGWGDRLQLKYEVPIATATDENNTTRAGLGESLLGIKWRPYEHHRQGEPKSDENMNFSLGTFPQASINNPTSSVRRGVVDPGPQYYIPVEFTARLGPVSFDGEVGRWIGNRHVPSRWGRGLIVGHEFNERFELYGEIYDLQDANRIGNEAKQRQLTLDVGGRQALGRSGRMRLLFMGGRAMQAVTRENSEPSWIAYLGLQVVLGPKENPEPDQK
jgi:hypothetical protein